MKMKLAISVGLLSMLFAFSSFTVVKTEDLSKKQSGKNKKARETMVAQVGN